MFTKLYSLSLSIVIAFYRLMRFTTLLIDACPNCMSYLVASFVRKYWPRSDWSTFLLSSLSTSLSFISLYT